MKYPASQEEVWNKLNFTFHSNFYPRFFKIFIIIVSFVHCKNECQHVCHANLSRTAYVIPLLPPKHQPNSSDLSEAQKENITTLMVMHLMNNNHNIKKQKQPKRNYYDHNISKVIQVINKLYLYSWLPSRSGLQSSQVEEGVISCNK